MTIKSYTQPPSSAVAVTKSAAKAEASTFFLVLGAGCWMLGS